MAPVAQARTPSEVADQLQLLSNPLHRQQLSNQGREFVSRQLSPDVFLNRLQPLLADVSRPSVVS